MHAFVVAVSKNVRFIFTEKGAGIQERDVGSLHITHFEYLFNMFF